MPDWLRPGPVWLFATLLALVAAIPLAWADTAVETDNFSLRYDETVWTREPSAPPNLVSLHCGPPSCPTMLVVTFLRDERPLPQPGFAPFGPGAVSGAAIDLRLQSLTPGSRLRPRRPAEPVSYGGMTGYRGLYDVEDRALAKTAAAIALLRLPDASLEIRLKADRLTPADLILFDRLLEGVAGKP